MASKSIARLCARKWHPRWSVPRCGGHHRPSPAQESFQGLPAGWDVRLIQSTLWCQKSALLVKNRCRSHVMPCKQQQGKQGETKQTFPILRRVCKAAAKSRRAWPSMGMFRNCRAARSVTSKMSDPQTQSGTYAAFATAGMSLSVCLQAGTLSCGHVPLSSMPDTFIFRVAQTGKRADGRNDPESLTICEGPEIQGLDPQGFFLSLFANNKRFLTFRSI